MLSCRLGSYTVFFSLFLLLFPELVDLNKNTVDKKQSVDSFFWRQVCGNAPGPQITRHQKYIQMLLLTFERVLYSENMFYFSRCSRLKFLLIVITSKY